MEGEEHWRPAAGSRVRSPAAASPRSREPPLRKLISLTMTGVMAVVLGAGISGCSEEASVKSEQTTKGPGGTTTVTKETKVEKSNDKAPPPGQP